MPQFDTDLAQNVEAAARHYLSRKQKPSRTRRDPPTIIDIAKRYNCSAQTVRKYAALLQSGQTLPRDHAAGRPPALTDSEEDALSAIIQMANRGFFKLSATMVVNAANCLRQQRLQPAPPVSRNWFPRWRAKHPEFDFNNVRWKEVARLGAEATLEHLENWFEEYQALLKAFEITPCCLWNFDESPFQVGWLNGSYKVVCVRTQKRTKVCTSPPP